MAEKANKTNLKDDIERVKLIHGTFLTKSLEIEEANVAMMHRLVKEHDNVDLHKQYYDLKISLMNVTDIVEGASFLIDFYEIADDEDQLLELEAEVRKFFIMYNKYIVSGKFEGEDKLHAIMSIKAGAGGTEAEDWTAMLFRMYGRWCANNGFTTDITNVLHSLEAKDGFKKIVFLVEGTNAYGTLKGENGVHRLIRKSPFDKNNKRHTSFASVKVSPLVDKTIHVNLDMNDVKIETMRGSGAGGQHRNKTDSAVRMTHIPTRITAYCQSERSQYKNKETAYQILYSRLYEYYKDIKAYKEAEFTELLNAFGGSQRRTYCIHPNQYVKDHLNNISSPNTDRVLNGDIDMFLFLED